MTKQVGAEAQTPTSADSRADVDHVVVGLIVLSSCGWMRLRRISVRPGYFHALDVPKIGLVVVHPDPSDERFRATLPARRCLGSTLTLRALSRGEQKGNEHPRDRAQRSGIRAH